MCRPLFLSKESRPLIIQNLLLLVNLFSQLIRNMISPCVHLAMEKSKGGSIVIGFKTKIVNPGYTTMQKKMQLFVLLAQMQLEWISSQVKMQTKHPSQMASLIGKMLGQKTEVLTNTSDLRLIEKLTNDRLQYQMPVVIFLLRYLPRSMKQGR